jgi:hypothetical protein
MGTEGARTRCITRRRLVEIGAGLAAAALTGDAFAGRESTRREARVSDSTSPAFLTEPTWNPPAITVGTPASGTAPGLVFVAPTGHNAMFVTQATTPGQFGPMILDNSGEPVWFLPLATEVAQNFRAQTYRGRPVLTWYEGPTGSTYGGSCVIYDGSYRELKRVHGGNGYSCDLHEFLITERGTALLSIYNEVTANLTSIGGPATGQVTEGIVQELDIETGKVLFEWHSLDHVALAESYRTTPDSSGNVDYFHLNSIGIDEDDNLLISARHTSTIYKLDRKKGDVIWRLGGTKSDFELGPGAAFNFQHDARTHEDGTLTLFDNGATGTGTLDVEPMSRPLRLRLDLHAMSASLVQTYETTTSRLATALGNVQQQPHGGVFVGWGAAGAFSEFAPAGAVIFDATFPAGVESYRAFRLPWVGTPATAPAVSAVNAGNGQMTVYASWNGATEVAHWQLNAGPGAHRLTGVTRAARAGFETAIIAPAAPYVSVTALDADREALGTSATVAVSAGA